MCRKDGTLIAEDRVPGRFITEVGLVFILLVVLVGVFFYDVVFQGQTLRASNTISTTLPEGHFNYPGGRPSSMAVYDNTPAVLEEPYQAFKDRTVPRGIVPLWNPYQAGGYPFWATLESSLLFLPELLLYVIPPPWDWDVYLLGRLVLAGFFTYLFMRLHDVGVLASIVAGASYMFSGPVIAWVTNVTLNADMLLPLFLWSLELILRRPLKRYVLLGAFVLFQAIAGGHPEHAFFLVLTSAIYLGFRLAAGAYQNGIRDAAIRLAMTFVGGFGLSAVLVIPFVEYALFQSWHIHGTDVGLEYESLKTAITILLPWYYSNDLVSYQNWTYNTWPGGWIGFVPIWLISLTVFAKPRNQLSVVFLAVFGVYLLKAYGFILVNWIGYLPVLSMVRLPLHVTQNIAFAGAVLCGLGVESLFDRGNLKRFLLAVVPLVLAVGLFVNLYPPTNDPAVVFGFAGGICVILLVGVLVCLRADWGPRWCVYMVVGALLVELFVLIPRERSARAHAFQEPPYVQFLRSDRTLNRVYGLGGALFPNTATAFGLYDIGMYEGLFVNRFADYVRELVDPRFFNKRSFHAFRGDIRDPSNQFLDLLNLKYLIAPRGTTVSDEQMTRLSLKPVYENEVTIYERRNVFPRAIIRHRADVVADDERALDLLKSGYDIRERVLLNKLPVQVSLDQGLAPQDGSHVELLDYAINSKAFQVEMEHEGVLAVADVNYPGWTVEVDGQPGEVLTTNYLFQGVYLPAGSHTVTFAFRPLSFHLGLFISVVTTGFLLAYARWGRWHHTRRGRS
jgi:hypothetical protein